MPAKPQVRYFDSRHGYYCQWNHKQYLLAKGADDAPTGPTYLDALAKFQEIMQLGAVNEAGGDNMIRVVLETYIQHISTKKSPGTVEIRHRCYKPFADFRPTTGGAAYGERTVSSLTHNQVYAFLAAMEKPAKRGRDQKGRKASRIRPDRFKHKNANKGKERVIFLAGETLATVRELVAKFPTGPLFRRKVDRGFHKTCIVMAFQKLQRKMKMPMLTAYSYRHTFATEMLKAGMDVETLAELMGNSAAVIRLHYSHLLADKPALRGKLERFRTLAAGTQNRPAPASAAGQA
jgi:integrase